MEAIKKATSPEFIRRLDLDISRGLNGGHNYQWLGQHGEVVCCGWAPGNKLQVRAAAVAHLKGEK